MCVCMFAIDARIVKLRLNFGMELGFNHRKHHRLGQVGPHPLVGGGVKKVHLTTLASGTGRFWQKPGVRLPVLVQWEDLVL